MTRDEAIEEARACVREHEMLLAAYEEATARAKRAERQRDDAMAVVDAAINALPDGLEDDGGLVSGVAEAAHQLGVARRERDEARAQVKAWQDEELERRRERDEARAVVAALREAVREVEELLGIAAGPAGDDRLREGVEAVRRLRSERDVALALLVRVVKYEREDRAVTPGTTRLARVCEEARALLARVGGAP